MIDGAFSSLHSQTSCCAPPCVPEVSLHMATAATPLWSQLQDRLRFCDLPPPFWAIAWPGGQGVARYILDHPKSVIGKRVLDIGAGCGLCAIAAAKAGAKSAFAVDCDPEALAATTLNAALNDVSVKTALRVDFTKPYKKADVILAGDVCYQQAMSTTLLRWLRFCVSAGSTVFLGDPGRAYVPDQGVTALAHYDVPTPRDLEDQDARHVTVWQMEPFVESAG